MGLGHAVSKAFIVEQWMMRSCCDEHQLPLCVMHQGQAVIADRPGTELGCLGPAGSFTLTGTSLEAVLPPPSWPDALLPQAST